MKLFAVVGNPVLHSRSPELHNAGFKALGISARYTRLAAQSAAQALELGRELGLSGLNVTAPFKEELCSLLSEKNADATSASAVNTVLFNGDRCAGFNTDVSGVSRILERLPEETRDRPALVLGAGGAARAAVVALDGLDYSVVVANRNLEKAQGLAKLCAGRALPLYSSACSEAAQNAAVVVNTLPSDLLPFDPAPTTQTQFVVDANYNPPSIFAQKAAAAGATIVTGEQWLLEQGLAAFELFTSVAAPRASMTVALRTPTSRAKKSVAFVGMMGSGKTTLSGLLAQALSVKHLELDQMIERDAGKTIPDIFAERGESAFRTLETKALCSIDPNVPAVISCGGGAVLNAENRQHLSKFGLVIWLWCNPVELEARLSSARHARPLLNGVELAPRIQQLINDRRDHYAAVADLIMPTHFASESDCNSRILNELHRISW